MFDPKLWRKGPSDRPSGMGGEAEGQGARVLHFPHLGSDIQAARDWLSSDEAQRLLVGLCGSTLAMLGLRRRSVGGLLMTFVGGALAVRAALGKNDLVQLQQCCEGGLPRAERTPPDDDSVAEASDESFPASDAPSWTSTTGTHPQRER